jgi:hypothetical protein
VDKVNKEYQVEIGRLKDELRQAVEKGEVGEKKLLQQLLHNKTSG